DLHGGYAVLHLELMPNSIVHARAGRDIAHPIGEVLHFDIDPKMVRFFNPKTELALSEGGAA
ncbi:MAG: hypothetical protein K8I82_25795, partial [Anaerolineae bacterium]|nr:hypothetical protein [Anaerolineae bacterium]